MIYRQNQAARLSGNKINLLLNGEQIYFRGESHSKKNSK